ncbi:MAG: hypothetical protein ACRBFS_16675 [Aureispira sp.]
MPYYQGGYYLVKLKELHFGSLVGRRILTPSSCLNDNCIDSWAYSWAGQEDKAYALERYDWSKEKLRAVEKWVDAQFEAGQVGWVEVFRTLEAAKEYKQLFFEEEEVLYIGISFSEQQQQELVEYFSPPHYQEGQVGLQQFLCQKTPENPAGEVLGYDLIGVEIDSSFHSLHCHDLQATLEQEFDVEFNANGLIREGKDWKVLVDYCNDENSGLAPVLWFYVKMKKYE